MHFSKEPMQCHCGSARCKGVMTSAKAADDEDEAAAGALTEQERLRTQLLRRAKALFKGVAAKPTARPTSLALIFNGRPTTEERSEVRGGCIRRIWGAHCCCLRWSWSEPRSL
jgi:hypothetical protein